MKGSTSLRAVIVLAAGMVLALAAGSTSAEVIVKLFADTYDRPNSLDLNASTEGKSGTLGPLNYATKTSGGYWDIQDNMLRGGESGGGGGGWLITYLNEHNFTDACIANAGGFSISIDLVSYATAGSGRWLAVAVGHSKAEVEAWSTNVGTGTVSDLFTGYRWTTKTFEVYDNGTLVANPNILSYPVPQTMRIDYALSDFDAGSTVDYKAYLGSDLITSGSFTWSGTDENYIVIFTNLSSRGARFDNFAITYAPYTTPPSTPAYWDLNGTTEGAGGPAPAGIWDASNTYWNAAAEGTGSVAAWTPGHRAVFAAGTDANGTYTVAVDGTQDIRGLTFEEGEGTVTISGGTALRLVANSPVMVGSALTATVETPITDDGGGRQLWKTGPGTLVLSGANAYTGGTAVLGGTLRLGADNVLPDASDVTVIGDGVTATLDANSHNDAIGGLFLGGAGATSGAAVATGGGTLTLGGDVAYDHYLLNPLGATISGKLGLGSATRTFAVNDSATTADELTVSADISGTGAGLIKAGAGKLILSGANSYDGGTIVNGGALQFNSPAAMGGTARDVTVNAAGAVVFGASFGDANIPAALAGRIVADSAGTIAADNQEATNFNFNAPGLTAARLGAVGSVSYTGTLTPQGTTYRLGGGGGALTMANTNALTGPGNSLAVSGSVVLAAANNYTGGTSLISGTLIVGHAGSLGSGALTITGGAVGASGTVVSTNTVSADGDFSIAGAGELTLGDMTLNADRVITNDNTAGTTTFGAINGTNTSLTISGNGNTTVPGVIGTGAAALTKTGAGTLTLSNNNTYTGATTVNGGTLVLSGSNSTSGVTLGAATLVINHAQALGPGLFTIAGAGTVQTDGAIVTTNPVAATSNFSIGGTGELTLGDMTINAGRTITNNNTAAVTTFGGISGGGANTNLAFAGDGDTAVTGVIATGTGSLTKQGTSMLTLTNAASTYTGVTNIAAGTLEASKLANGGSPSSIGRSTNVSTNLLLGNGATLKYTGAGDSTDRQFRFNGNLPVSITLDASGTGPINFTSATAPSNSNANQPRTLNLIGSNTDDNTLAAPLANNGTAGLSVVKDGAGRWILSGASTYTGATTVNGGALLVNGSLAGSVVTVNAGGALGGTGTLGGAVIVNAGGTFAPGASAGTLKVNTSVNMAADSIYQWEFDSPTQADKVQITGNLQLSAGWKLSLGGAGTPAPGSEYDLFSYTGAFAGDIAADIIFTPVGWPTATIGQDTTPGAGRIFLSFGQLGDTNNDGVVDAADFITVKKNFGKSVGSAGASAGDFDKTGTVDWADLSTLMSNMGAGGPAPATAPEPATLGLLALGALAVLRRRRSPFVVCP